MTNFDYAPSTGAEELRLVALHGLRLKGFSPTSTVAGLAHVDEDEAESCLVALADEGLVRHRGGERPGWSLTPEGRIEGERLLAAQLDASGRRPMVERAYNEFRALNPRLLQICCDWQVADASAGRLNDHADEAYDDAVIQALSEIDRRAQPVTATLACALERFGHYGPRLTDALSNIRKGEYQWFTKATIASYHSVWFELHEDLLATLGLDRATETANKH